MTLTFGKFFFRKTDLLSSFCNSNLFPSDKSIDKAVGNQANYQGYQHDYSFPAVSYIDSHKFGKA